MYRSHAAEAADTTHAAHPNNAAHPTNSTRDHTSRDHASRDHTSRDAHDDTRRPVAFLGDDGGFLTLPLQLLLVGHQPPLSCHDFCGVGNLELPYPFFHFHLFELCGAGVVSEKFTGEDGKYTAVQEMAVAAKMVALVPALPEPKKRA